MWCVSMTLMCLHISLTGAVSLRDRDWLIWDDTMTCIVWVYLFKAHSASQLKLNVWDWTSKIWGTFWPQVLKWHITQSLPCHIPATNKQTHPLHINKMIQWLKVIQKSGLDQYCSSIVASFCPCTIHSPAESQPAVRLIRLKCLPLHTLCSKWNPLKLNTYIYIIFFQWYTQSYQ